MDKFVVVRTDEEDINVVTYKDTFDKAYDVLIDNFLSYIDDGQKIDIVSAYISGETEEYENLMTLKRGMDTADAWISGEISIDECYHAWKIIPVAFE